MAGYSITNLDGGTQQALTAASSTPKTGIGIHAATGATTLKRFNISEFTFGVDGTYSGTDTPVRFGVQRYGTAAGTSTAGTPNLDNPEDTVASGATVGLNHTVEPTVTANTFLWSMGLNMRLGIRVQYQDRRELTIPAVNLNGLSFNACSPATSGYASTFTAAVRWFE
jgi:hypothetical protein